MATEKVKADFALEVAAEKDEDRKAFRNGGDVEAGSRNGSRSRQCDRRALSR
jgi:hypothetical protein